MNPTERFTERVENYVRFRPGYPEAVVDVLEKAGLAPGGVVADIGAGTGISSALFLHRGYHVTAVEPNAAMRAAAESALAATERFQAVAGRAEATGLDADFADLVVCAQAFHWTDRPSARDEFLRVAKPGGIVALMWNQRPSSGTPFLDEYEALLLEWGVDYADRIKRTTEDSIGSIQSLFGPRVVEEAVFPHAQHFDWEGLQGRALSASYVPLAGHPNHELFFAGLRRVYDHNQTNGTVAFAYECHLYWVKK